MNTISIYLAESGNIPNLKKDFDLYQGAYRNKLIDIYIPTNILVGNTFAVTIGCTYVDRAGKIVNSKAYNVPLIKDEVVVNKTKYAYFQALMPSDFTKHFGTVTMVVNVVNLADSNTINIITSQKADFSVLRSARLEGEEIVDPSEVERIYGELNKKQDKIDDTIEVVGTKSVVGAINYLNTILNVDYLPASGAGKSLVAQVIENLNKILVHDETLVTHGEDILENSRLIGLLDELTKNHEDRITSNTSRIGTNEADIKKLQDDAFTGVNKVSTIKANKAPFPIPVDELNAEVQRVEGRSPKNGDYIVWKDTLNMKTYEIWFSGGLDGHWQEPDEVEPINQANNRIFGIIRGNAEDTEQTSLKVSIINGIINDIRVLAGNGSYKSITSYLNGLNTALNGILSGATKVPKAINADEAKKATNANHATTADSATFADTANSANSAGIAETADEADKAINDINGNPIDTTYAKVANVYTKDEADGKFLPIDYSYVYYYSKDGIVDVVPKDAMPQFSVSTSNIGETTLFKLQRNLDRDYTFTKNTTDESTVWVQPNVNATNVKFKLITSLIRGGEIIPLAITLTQNFAELPFTSPTPIEFKTIYNELIDKVVTTSEDILVKELKVVRTTSTPINFDVYSNETYPSSFNLVTKSLSFDVETITGKKKYSIKASDWVQTSNGYKVTVPQSKHGLAPSNQYGIDVMYASGGGWQRAVVSPLITNSGDITITSEKPLDCEMLIWVAVDIENIGKNGTLLYLDDTLITELTAMVRLGSHKDGTKFNIAPEVVAKMFGDISPKVNMEWSQYSLDLYRFDREAGGDKIYYTNVLIYNKVRYTYTLEVNRTDNSGILYMTEEPIMPQPTEQDKGKVLGVNQQGDYEYVGNVEPEETSATANKYKFNQLFNTENSILPSANGLTVTNIYGGHHITGTTDHQYYHKMYDIATISGHWYYFAPNFSDTKSVYILGHIDGTAFSTNKGKVFEGGSKFDAYIQIEKDKTMDFDVQPILVDLTEMFGSENEPTTDTDVYQYIAPNTYFPYNDTNAFVTKNRASAEANRFRFNQLINPDELETPSQAGYIITQKNGIISIVGSSNKMMFFYFLGDYFTYKFNTEHKYAFLLNDYGTTNGMYPALVFLDKDGNQKTVKNGYSIVSNIKSIKDWHMTCPPDDYDFTISPNIIDLTEMFGAGNEPSSVDELYKYIVKGQYYPYVDTPTKEEINTNMMGVPSDTIEQIDLTFENDITRYTATRNGYLMVAIFSPKPSEGFIQQLEGGNFVVNLSYPSFNAQRMTMPVRKGFTYQIKMVLGDPSKAPRISLIHSEEV